MKWQYYLLPIAICLFVANNAFADSKNSNKDSHKHASNENSNKDGEKHSDKNKKNKKDKEDKKDANELAETLEDIGYFKYYIDECMSEDVASKFHISNLLTDTVKDSDLVDSQQSRSVVGSFIDKGENEAIKDRKSRDVDIYCGSNSLKAKYNAFIKKY